MREPTVDSITQEMQENRRMMRGMSPKLSSYQKLLKRNEQLGAALSALKKGEAVTI